ncbi:MAG TPA: ribosome maturation factor RimM [Candidatus Acidoferrales bacterium]|nr:ribosome maturation factor RimM [Candidatus Acidoferrales bacterium]
MNIGAAYLTVARILRPHGVRGEVAAEILTDFPERLKRLTCVELFNPASHVARDSARSVRVQSCWLSRSRGGQAIFHFQGSDSIDDAKRLVGLEVQIPLAERVPLPQGSYYISDLAGCEVIEAGVRVLGRVREVEFIGEDLSGTPNLVVDSASGELLIPLAQDICTSIDIVGRRITVALPEGLLDLNANS